MNGFYNGPYGECSEQMYKLYQLLKAKGVTLYNGFLPKDSFFFEIGSDRYAVWDEPDGNGLHMVWTKRYERDHRNPYQLVEVATARAVLDNCYVNENLNEPLVENAELQQRITTQKQTIQAYRDESREWCEVAEHAQAENAKLRKLVNDMWICVSHGSGWDCTGCERDPDSVCIMGISEFSQRMRELGIEVE